MELEKKMTELGEVVAAFKKSNDAEIEALKKNGHVAADIKEKTEKLNEQISTLQEEIKGLKTAANRGHQGGNANGNEQKDAYAKAAGDYFRKGVDTRSTEVKAMSVDSDVDGGFLVTPEMSTEIVKKIYESTPLRQLASVQTISSDSLEILEDLDETEVGWVGETQSRPSTATPQLKKIQIFAHEMYAKPKATQKLLDDAAINVEMWLSDKIAEKMARKEATAFTVGDGANKPKGILAYDAGTGFGQLEQVNTGLAAAIKPDSLIDLIYSLKSDYRKNAKFLMNRLTAKELRKFKDNENRYLWAPGMDGNTAGSILGYEIVEGADMPVVAANALTIAFGDFKQGYQIVDRVGIRVLRDPYSAKPYIEFYTTKRVGGGVKNFEAIKILKVAV